MRWIVAKVADVRHAQAKGISLRGYTRRPFFNMIEWDYRLESAPLFPYNVPVGPWANGFKVSGALNAWGASRDGMGQWGPRYAGLDELTRQRTPLADHFRAYATGAR